MNYDCYCSVVPIETLNHIYEMPQCWPTMPDTLRRLGVVILGSSEAMPGCLHLACPSENMAQVLEIVYTYPFLR